MNLPWFWTAVEQGGGAVTPPARELGEAVAVLREYAMIGAGVVDRRKREVREALATLQARLAEVEAERGSWKESADNRYETQTRYKIRAIAAEERVRELEALLREAQRCNLPGQLWRRVDAALAPEPSQ